jgi:hypothetical protein
MLRCASLVHSGNVAQTGHFLVTCYSPAKTVACERCHESEQIAERSMGLARSMCISIGGLRAKGEEIMRQGGLLGRSNSYNQRPHLPV